MASENGAACLRPSPGTLGLPKQAPEHLRHRGDFEAHLDHRKTETGCETSRRPDGKEGS